MIFFLLIELQLRIPPRTILYIALAPLKLPAHFAVGILVAVWIYVGDARRLPTLSDGVVLRVRRASGVTLALWLLSNQEIDVQKLLLPMIGILTTVLACGCNGAKSPAAVATDVAAAQRQASTEVTDARKEAAKNVDSTAANADGSAKDLKDVSASSEYDVAVAQADGAHNVAIQQCLAQTGEAQKSCKERADAAYDQSKTHANVTRLSKLQ
jgi:hypothetical protein